MALKKITQRNSAGISETMVILIIALAIYMAGFLYVAGNIESSGATVNSTYNETYSNFTETHEQIKNKTEQIRENLAGITEASSAIQVAWNGLKGLGNTVKLTLYFIGSGLGIFDQTAGSLDIIPDWAYGLIFTGILLALVFVIFKLFLKGET